MSHFEDNYRSPGLAQGDPMQAPLVILESSGDNHSADHAPHHSNRSPSNNLGPNIGPFEYTMAEMLAMGSRIKQYNQTTFQTSKSFALIDVKDWESNKDPSNLRNAQNPRSCATATALVNDLVKSYHIDPGHITVLCPYSSQAQCYRAALHFLGLEKVCVSTVRGYQYDRNLVVVFDFTAHPRHLFLERNVLLAMAFTRGQAALFIVADYAAMRGGEVNVDDGHDSREVRGLKALLAEVARDRCHTTVPDSFLPIKSLVFDHLDALGYIASDATATKKDQDEAQYERVAASEHIVQETAITERGRDVI
ncbi:hypothetical protein BDW74DRAFT_175636 [Aspergillus multicolor]|uniref:uncharacterized protein n=1 Tax=Aspergillus multicolor TaxID=41759 RepID=UPI003CCDA400